MTKPNHRGLVLIEIVINLLSHELLRSLLVYLLLLNLIYAMVHLQVTESDVESDCSAELPPQRYFPPLNPSGSPQCAAFISATAVAEAAASWGPIAAAAAEAAEATAGASGAALCTACAPGMFGVDCAASCSDDTLCRGRGFCDGMGRCVCFYPFTGLTCDMYITDEYVSATSANSEGADTCDPAAALDPTIADLQPVGYLDGLHSADFAAAAAAKDRISSAMWEGDTLTLTIGQTLPAWKTIRVDIPSSAGIRVPKYGVDDSAAKQALNASIGSESASVANSGPSPIAISAPRLRCESVILQVPGNRFCAGDYQLRVCAPSAAAAVVFAEQVGLPLLMNTTVRSCADSGGPCPVGASWAGPDQSGCCGAGVGAGDFAFCATNEDCIFDPVSTGMEIAAASGVPMVTRQCCDECQRLATQTICGDMAPSEIVESCRVSGCSPNGPCAGRAVSGITGPLAGRGAPATVSLATGAGLQIPSGVWPVSAPATINVVTGKIPSKSFPKASVLVSDVLELGPSGINFTEPGVTVVFALSDQASYGPSPGRVFWVFRLTNGIFVKHPFVPTFNPPKSGTESPALLLVKTLSFSSYAVFDILDQKVVVTTPLPYSNGSFTTPQPNNGTEIIFPTLQQSGSTSSISWAAIGAGIGGAVVVLAAAILLSNRIRAGWATQVDGKDAKITWTGDMPLVGPLPADGADEGKIMLLDSDATDTTSPTRSDESEHDEPIPGARLQAPVTPSYTADLAAVAAGMEEAEPEMTDFPRGRNAVARSGKAQESALAGQKMFKPSTDQPPSSSVSENAVIPKIGSPSNKFIQASVKTNPPLIESRPSLAAPTAAAAAAIAAASTMTRALERKEDAAGLVVSRMPQAEASADIIVLEHWRQEVGKDDAVYSSTKGRKQGKLSTQPAARIILVPYKIKIKTD